MKLPLPLPLRLVVCIGVAAVASITATAVSRDASNALPAAISDREFWRLSHDFSEPNGSFRSENLVSNEMVFDRVLPPLVGQTKAGGVYLGVGPEQNFTYIAAMRPRIAFILDIRRGNLLLHLLYKALFELSRDRAEFAARLFTRAAPAAVGPDGTARELFEALRLAPMQDETAYHRNFTAVQDVLTTHGFELTASDLLGLDYVYSSFRRFGPSITYQSSANGTAGGRTTYAELMTQTDAAGAELSYLATAARFGFVKSLQAKNLVVPVVGDFAGPKALRAIGQYVRDAAGVVGAFYVSNVESYLRQDDKWMAFCLNVTALPIDEASIFVRPLGVAMWAPSAGNAPATLAGPVGHMASEVRACTPATVNPR